MSKLLEKGGHGGFPHNAVNPIITAAKIAEALLQIPATNVQPFETAVVTVSCILSGQKGVFNIIPEEAIVEGNIRTFNNELVDVIEKRIIEITKGICDAERCECKVDVERGYPATMNNKEVVEKIRPGVVDLGYEVITTNPIMGSEDFSRYSLIIPGVLINIGTYNQSMPETKAFVHNGKLMIDEEVMVIALQTFLAIYLEMVDTN